MGIFVKVVIGDAEEGMKDIETGSVQLTCCSPPYFNMRNTFKWPTYIEYMQKMRDIFTDVFRVTENGRVCAVNVCDYIEEGVKYPLVADYIKMLQGIGFTYEDCIWWVKPKGVGASGSAGSRAGNFIKYGYPLYYRPNNITEGIIITRKGKIDYSRYPKYKVDYHKFYDYVDDVWKLNTVPSGRQPKFSEPHPAVFPYELPYNLINLYTLKGELVIDPFCGTGTTLKAARDSFRNSIGFEIDGKWLKNIKENVGYGNTALGGDINYEIIHLDKKTPVAPPKFDKTKEGFLKWI